MNAARPAVDELLPIVVGEQRTLACKAVDFQRAASHHTAVVCAVFQMPTSSAMIMVMLGLLEAVIGHSGDRGARSA